MENDFGVLCDNCRYNETDEEGEDFCRLVLDEDEYARLEIYNTYSGKKSCPYFSPAGDEYDIVRKQN